MVAKKIGVGDLQKMKETGEKISMLTAYDAIFADLVNESGIEIILIGDSLGMVVMGYESTIPVTLEDIIHHTKAVVNKSKHAMVVADMPFGYYEGSDEQAVLSSIRLIKEGGAQAVKVEGGNEMVQQRVRAIVNAGIPVMAHLGLTPQSASLVGSFRVQGREVKVARMIRERALKMEEIGAFSVLFECIPSELARAITKELKVPTIGIGAGVDCDGQVLVTQDMLGLYPTQAKHAKKYCDLRTLICEKITQYRDEIKEGKFPGEENTFHMGEDEISKIYGG